MLVWKTPSNQCLHKIKKNIFIKISFQIKIYIDLPDFPNQKMSFLYLTY